MATGQNKVVPRTEQPHRARDSAPVRTKAHGVKLITSAGLAPASVRAPRTASRTHLWSKRTQRSGICRECIFVREIRGSLRQGDVVFVQRLLLQTGVEIAVHRVEQSI